MMEHEFKYAVIGGGIAGVTCVEQLSALCPDDKILLITASSVVKAITNISKVTSILEDFCVVEKPSVYISENCPNVTVKQTRVTNLQAQKHKIITDEDEYEYGKLCVCMGGTPNIISKNCSYVLGIRDTESVQEFQKRIANAQRIMIIGNGGIATELVYEVEDCEVIWAIKDKSISKSFIDAGAAEFLLPQLSQDKQSSTGSAPTKRRKYTIDGNKFRDIGHGTGTALGPDWSEGLLLKGLDKISHNVKIEYNVEVEAVMEKDEYRITLTDAEQDALSVWPVYVKLTNGTVYGCDFVVSATGVTPNTETLLKNNKFEVAEDGGLKVNDKMQTNILDVYAAGDICSAFWNPSPTWFQMRLWSQARQMGSYAAKSMVSHTRNQDILMDFCFEMFAHVTRFFNYKVVLLGRYNAQGLSTNYELLLRVTKGKEYVKVVLKGGQMQGAILIGETDLEETFENLILNKMDLSQYGEDLLDPNIDIEDYFD